MAEYLVIKREVCPECNGKGYVQHPAWVAYLEANQQPTTLEQDIAWFREYGLEVKSARDFPPEEIPCGCCDRGYIQSLVNIQDVLHELWKNS